MNAVGGGWSMLSTMRRPLLHCLIALTLLLQGLGSAWAVSMMAAMDVQMAAQAMAITELPPCHQEAALETAEAQSPRAGMDCCGTGSCQCLMGCGVLSLAVSAGSTALFQRQSPPPGERLVSALRASHTDPALRPPASPQS